MCWGVALWAEKALTSGASMRPRRVRCFVCCHAHDGPFRFCEGCGAELSYDAPAEERRGKGAVIPLEDVSAVSIARLPSGADELLGGGWARGASYLVSGGAGVGKSTWLLGSLALAARAAGGRLLVICTEMPAGLVRHTAERAGAPLRSIAIVDDVDGAADVARLVRERRPSVLLVDSVSDLRVPRGGSVVAGCKILRAAARAGAVSVGIAHQNAEGKTSGGTSGPHAVDGVLRLRRLPADRGGGVALVVEKHRYGPSCEGQITVAPALPAACALFSAEADAPPR